NSCPAPSRPVGITRPWLRSPPRWPRGARSSQRCASPPENEPGAEPWEEREVGNSSFRVTISPIAGGGGRTVTSRPNRPPIIRALIRTGIALLFALLPTLTAVPAERPAIASASADY